MCLLQGIYFAAISFSDLKKTLAVQDAQGWLLVALFVSPILFWLVSLAFAVRVFKPETYRTNLASPDLARQTYQDIVAYKHARLRRAHRALVIGFIPLILLIAEGHPCPT